MEGSASQSPVPATAAQQQGVGAPASSNAPGAPDATAAGAAQVPVTSGAPAPMQKMVLPGNPLAAIPLPTGWDPKAIIAAPGSEVPAAPAALATDTAAAVLPNTTATITEAAAAAQQQQQLLWHQALQMATVGVGAPLAPPCVGATQFLATAAPVSFPANFSQLASLYHLPPTAVLSSAAAAPPAQAAAPTGSSAKKRKAVETSQEEVSRKQHKRASVVSLASSTVPSSVAAASCSTFGDDPPPRPKSGAELEKMTAAERRRYERNLREQQRSHRISQQIKKLRDVLTESNIPFRPNKYSILLSVADYIKQLQSRAIMLDAEHQRLIDTIRETTERVKTGQAVPEEVASFDQQGVDDDLLLVQGLDYKAVFEHCPYPLGVASLDGRILACNPEFEQVLACRHGELAEQSLFVFIRNHQEIFEAMASLLKRSSMEQETGLMQQQLLYWCGHITSSRNEKLPFTITLTSTADDNPKYFSFSAAAAHPN